MSLSFARVDSCRILRTGWNSQRRVTTICVSKAKSFIDKTRFA